MWLKPIVGREYVVAVDSAGGGEDGDFAAVQVVEIATGLQCAELRERLRPEDLARVSVELAKEYGGTLIAVERNNHGAAVLAYIETREGYRRVYKQQGEPGWLTSAASKPEIVARMGVLLSDTPERFMSRRLLAECRTFVADERGRAAAAAGSHDDLVMAMAIAQAVRAETMAWSGRTSGARLLHGTPPRPSSLDPAEEERALAVVAVQAIRRMRGGAQSQLMLGADGQLWVVKFQNNPQHRRVLANELIATRLAEAIGLTVPKATWSR